MAIYQTINIYITVGQLCFITNELGICEVFLSWSQKQLKLYLIWQSCYSSKWLLTQGLLVVNYTNVPIKWVAKGLEYILSLHLFISLKFLLHTCYKISSNDSKEQAPYNYSRSPFFPSRYELAGIYIQSLPPPKGGDLLSWQPLEELSNWLTDWLTREDKAVFCLQQGKVW